MKIKIWGQRGSIPTPLSSKQIEDKIKRALSYAKIGDLSSEESINSFVGDLPLSIKGTYGGNTTCIQVDTLSEEKIIIDCGSGLKYLGNQLMSEDFGKGKGVANILVTHTHWDHIQGLPFFVPFFIKGNVFNLYSPLDDLRERLEHQQAFTHFPIPMTYMQSTKNYYKIEQDNEFFINDTRVYCKTMPHPGGAYGYRIDDGDNVAVFTSDCEFNLDSIENIDEYKDLFIDADVVFFDTQYTFHESFEKYDWGHSSASIAIDIVSKFNVKKIVLFHHDPDYDDEKLDSLLVNAKAYISINEKRYGDLEVDIAYEGMVVEL